MRTITLQRDHFIENYVESEFNWVLQQLGIPHDQHNKINIIELLVEDIKIIDNEIE